MWAQIFPYLAQVYYLRYIHEDNGQEEMSSTNSTSSSLGSNNAVAVNASTKFSSLELRNAQIICTLVWFSSALAVAFLIKPKYLKTFASTMTGSQYSIATFRNSSSDFIKFDALFSNHRSYWEPIKEEVKVWVAERYPVWQVEKPVWFDDAAVSQIPSDVLPKEALKDLILKGGGERGRRASVKDALSRLEN